MKYLSEYGNKIFDSKQMCLEYEQSEKKCLAEEMAKQRHDILLLIEKKFHELENLVFEFRKTYGSTQEICFSSFTDLLIIEILDLFCKLRDDI